MPERLEASTGERELRLTRIVLVGSFACSIPLALLLSFRDPWFAAGVLGLVLTLGGALTIASTRHQQGRDLGWLLSLAILNLLLVTPELALRVADFRYESGVQFGYPRPSDFVSLELDEDLLWKLRPDLEGVNSEGFPGAEFVIPKPKGQFRMLFLGDSCTQQGHPLLVEAQLNAEHGSGFASVSLAVAGYSSQQGLRAARLYGARLDPDLVFVQFGWNDHWLARGARDSQKAISASQLRLDLLVHRYRLAQAFLWLRSRLGGAGKPRLLDEPRVTEEEYRSNLLAIRDEFAARGIPVVFVTAPTAQRRLGVPHLLVEKGFARDEAEVVELHRRYNEIVRSLAREQGTLLLDLDAEFSLLPEAELARIFSEDGIHFTDAGLAAVASRHARFVDARLSRLRRSARGR